MGNCASDVQDKREQIPSPASPVPSMTITTASTLTDSTLWKNGNAVVVYAYGPGRLHLLAVPDSNLPDKSRSNVIGSTRTELDYTEFAITFSYYFQRFIFYWEGDSKTITAQYGTRPIGGSWDKLTLGTSWYEATEVNRQGVFNKVCLEDWFVEDAIETDEATVFIYMKPDSQAPHAPRTSGRAAEQSPQVVVSQPNLTICHQAPAPQLLITPPRAVLPHPCSHCTTGHGAGQSVMACGPQAVLPHPCFHCTSYQGHLSVGGGHRFTSHSCTELAGHHCTS